MLRLHFAGPQGHPLESALSDWRGDHGAILSGTTSTAQATVDAMRTPDHDAVLFPLEWVDLMRTVKASTSDVMMTPLIVASELPSKAGIVRAFACGFHGAVHFGSGYSSAAERIASIVDGSWTLDSEPILRELAVSRGLLAKELVTSDSDDGQLVDLLGTGLTDDEIARLMDWTVQRVRNRIERLLHDNALMYRTQLAVIRAASLKVPDFS